ncbi:uncharacterized protein RSE6_03743 [Rhynchosporium secalis]|uniref:Major facilitator superfamily (MFS) profile domain-containing protein n=1 Tax=Rhynchosporium secalis TaxID=38038 RepID=A0A1E1M3J1_RHYSE|nr:uncharacterized protein RSE6_03743 [Rhynchosporium secalis]
MKASKGDAKHLLAHLFFFMGVHFLLAFREILLVVPLIELFEQSLCFSYYSVHDLSIIGHGGWILEALCKIAEIQHDLATIRGWKLLLDTAPVVVLLVAIPTGKLGDKYGRRKVMTGSLLGVTGSLILIFAVFLGLRRGIHKDSEGLYPQIFPLRLVWLWPVFLLCGGGLYTSAALMWTMASEACDNEERAEYLTLDPCVHRWNPAVYNLECTDPIRLTPIRMENIRWSGVLFGDCHRQYHPLLTHHPPHRIDDSGEIQCPSAGHRPDIDARVFIFSAAFGSRVSTLSYTSYMIPDSFKASFYAALAFLENIGHAFGDPAMQQIFAAVIRGPKVWLATPFFVVALVEGLYISAGIVTLFLREEKLKNSTTWETQLDHPGPDSEPLLA